MRFKLRRRCDIMTVPAHAMLLASMPLQATFAATISLDRGWLFRLGNVAKEQLSCEDGAVNAWEHSMAGWVCPTWPRKGFGDAWRTETECALYCCSDPSCIGYLYNGTAPGTCGRESGCTPSCIIGGSMDGCYAAAAGGFTAGKRRSIAPATVPMPPPTGPQAIDYDDSG
eukprot:SAG11_NODE_12443_length_703_cov_0.956954_1_plen_169_part_10